MKLGKYFTPWCMFGCTSKVKLKILSFDHKIRPLTRKMDYIFHLPSNHFLDSHTHREREREREREIPKSKPEEDTLIIHAKPKPRMKERVPLVKPKISLRPMAPFIVHASHSAGVGSFTLLSSSSLFSLHWPILLPPQPTSTSPSLVLADPPPPTHLPPFFSLKTLPQTKILVLMGLFIFIV